MRAPQTHRHGFGRFVPQLPPGLGIVLAIGGTIAALAPFDIAFATATGDSAASRVVLFCILAILGTLAGQRIGLRLLPSSGGHLLGLAFALLVAICVAGTDVLFRPILHDGYVDFMHKPLELRLVYFMLRAFNENVFYRLFLFSVLAWGITRVWLGATSLPTPAVMWFAMIAAQVVNIGLNVCLFDPPSSAINIVYYGIRYIAPGVCWAWLYWRSGFAAAEIASVCCHVFLQPLIGQLI